MKGMVVVGLVGIAAGFIPPIDSYSVVCWGLGAVALIAGVFGDD